MKALLDTSVFVAAWVEAHARHEQAFPWLQRIRGADVKGVIASHSVVETYAVLSSLPVNPRITPSTAWALVEQSVLPFVETVDLVAKEVQQVVQRLSRHGLADGIIYDALIAEVAVKARAECIVTLNTGDFRRVSQGGSIMIREP
jgi:predicted nucleic acid-binding protein